MTPRVGGFYVGDVLAPGYLLAVSKQTIVNNFDCHWWNFSA
jgi:hypothetical protein